MLFTVRHIALPQIDGFAIIGSPIWGSPENFSSFVGSVVDKVSVFRDGFTILRIPK